MYECQRHEIDDLRRSRWFSSFHTFGPSSRCRCLVRKAHQTNKPIRGHAHLDILSWDQPHVLKKWTWCRSRHPPRPQDSRCSQSGSFSPHVTHVWYPWSSVKQTHRPLSGTHSRRGTIVDVVLRQTSTSSTPSQATGVGASL